MHPSPPPSPPNQVPANTLKPSVVCVVVPRVPALLQLLLQELSHLFPEDARNRFQAANSVSKGSKELSEEDRKKLAYLPDASLLTEQVISSPPPSPLPCHAPFPI